MTNNPEFPPPNQDDRILDDAAAAEDQWVEDPYEQGDQYARRTIPWRP
jgi:hypothetical protein